MNPQLIAEFDHLFRHEYGKIVSVLIGKYSPRYIDQIEDAIQEALLKAMKVWGYRGKPTDTSAWLYRVANNHFIDQLRRQKKTSHLADSQTIGGIYELQDVVSKNSIQDDQLAMIFACCHPTLSKTEQILLSLKIIGGLNIKEIAQALLKKEEAVKKSITRAKQKFEKKIKKLELPAEPELPKRMETVLKVIYLMFNEGYKASSGENLIKKDICEEAIRLACLLKRHSHCDSPDLNSLLALMCFNAARFDARLTNSGELLILEFQDRSLWDKSYVQWGIQFLNEATTANSLSQYHLEAGIASYYVSARNYEETEWHSILNLYDLLVKMNPSPIVALNRIVVLAKVQGVEIALKEITKMETDDLLLNNHLFYSIKADFMLQIDNKTKAKQLLTQAIELTKNKIETAFLQKKLAEIE